jgi:integrase
MTAMILLGINCGFSNADCGALPLAAVDLEAGIIDFPRPKTGIVRRCSLWPETVNAIREVRAARPTPKNPEVAWLVFITKYGGNGVKHDDPAFITKEMRKLRNASDFRGHRNFYTFRTVADEARDQPTADFIMGYEIPQM